MTLPHDAQFLSADSLVLGERLARSWILFAGVLPVDYDDLTIVEFDDGRRFLERSSMLSQRIWWHERIVEPQSHGCRVTDRIAFEPRLAFLAAIYGFVFRCVFRLRHHNLRRIFGAV
jgi:ligand-binding SRPBCC domain-containing protein